MLLYQYQSPMTPPTARNPTQKANVVQEQAPGEPNCSNANPAISLPDALSLSFVVGTRCLCGGVGPLLERHPRLVFTLVPPNFPLWASPHSCAWRWRRRGAGGLLLLWRRQGQEVVADVGSARVDESSTAQYTVHSPSRHPTISTSLSAPVYVQ